MSKDGHVWPQTQTAPHPLISAQKHLGLGWGGVDGCVSQRGLGGFKAAPKILGL